MPIQRLPTTHARSATIKLHLCKKVEALAKASLRVRCDLAGDPMMRTQQILAVAAQLGQVRIVTSVFLK